MKLILDISFLLTSVVASTYPAYADTESVSRPAYLSERSTLVDFNYEEIMIFLLVEDLTLELVKKTLETKSRPGQGVLRAKIDEVSSVGVVFAFGGERGCFSLFASIEVDRLNFEFGVLVDVEYLGDLNPVFTARARAECDTRHEEDGNVVYSLISFDDRRENQPVRLLYVDKETGMAQRVEREN
jgi:hypothetical protein